MLKVRLVSFLLYLCSVKIKLIKKKHKMDITFYIKQTQAALINANYTKDELHYLFTDVSNRRTVTDGFENNTPIIDVIADLADTMDCIRSIRETHAC